MADKIVVLDFGSQYNQLIARRIREMGVFSELKAHDTELEYFKNDPEIKGIVFSGGPNSVYEENALLVDPKIYELGLPVLGICYGMQIILCWKIRFLYRKTPVSFPNIANSQITLFMPQTCFV